MLPMSGLMLPIFSLLQNASRPCSLPFSPFQRSSYGCPLADCGGSPLSEVVEIVKTVSAVGGAARTLAAQVKLPQPLSRLAEILSSAALIGTAAPGAIGALFETLHALAQVIDFGLNNFGRHIWISASLTVRRSGSVPTNYSAGCAKLAALAPRSIC